MYSRLPEGDLQPLIAPPKTTAHTASINHFFIG
jgi:hypothetical protein